MLLISFCDFISSANSWFLLFLLFQRDFKNKYFCAFCAFCVTFKRTPHVNLIFHFSLFTFNLKTPWHKNQRTNGRSSSMRFSPRWPPFCRPSGWYDREDFCLPPAHLRGSDGSHEPVPAARRWDRRHGADALRPDSRLCWQHLRREDLHKRPRPQCEPAAEASLKAPKATSPKKQKSTPKSTQPPKSKKSKKAKKASA